MDEFFKALSYLAITAVIFFLAYYTTRLVAARAGKSINKSNLKIVERITAGRDKEIVIIKVADEYFLAGITSHSISFSGQLSEQTAESIENNVAIEYSPFPESYKDFGLAGKLIELIKKYIKLLKK